MGDPGKNDTTTGLVRSGSGQVVSSTSDQTLGEFAQARLGVDNAALLDTNTVLTYTQAADVTKSQLQAADDNYTTAMNRLSQFWSTDLTTGDAYDEAKIDAMNAESQWQLARDNLERVTTADQTSSLGPVSSLGTIDPQDAGLDSVAITPIDLSGVESQLSSALATSASTDAAPSSDTATPAVTTSSKIDQRVRFRPLSASSGSQGKTTYDLFGASDSVLYLLNETNGVFFPYTPTIDMSHKAAYSSMAPTHANTDYQIYTHTPAVQISIQGQFTSQNLAEARYTLAAMHFFRTVTKMHFGVQDTNAGLPPPVLILSGYGDFMLNDLRVVVTDFRMDLPADVDYIEVTIGGHSAWVPSLTTFAVTCVVQQTPKVQKTEFNFDDFASGKLLNGAKGWI